MSQYSSSGSSGAVESRATLSLRAFNNSQQGARPQNSIISLMPVTGRPHPIHTLGMIVPFPSQSGHFESSFCSWGDGGLRNPLHNGHVIRSNILPRSTLDYFSEFDALVRAPHVQTLRPVARHVRVAMFFLGVATLTHPMVVIAKFEHKSFHQRRFSAFSRSSSLCRFRKKCLCRFSSSHLSQIHFGAYSPPRRQRTKCVGQTPYLRYKYQLYRRRSITLRTPTDG